MKFSKMEIEKVEIKTELPDGYLLQEEESSEQVNQKPYKCGICGHRTTADTLLKVHMKMHFVKRLHQCQICKESFGFVTELNAHVLTHNKDLSGFRCEHCGKECFTEEDLHKHYRIHTKEKPYKCKLCMRSFSEEFYLRAHERSHHGEEYTKRTMMQDGTFVDPNVVKHLSDDTVRVSVDKEKEIKIFKNSHPLVPLSNDEKLLLLKFVQEMGLNTKYTEMESIKQYLKTSWVKMAQMFADNNYDRNPEKLARTFFHLKNHAKTHLERYYKNKKSPKPHQIDYVFVKLYPNEFEIPGLDMQELQSKGQLIDLIREDDITEIEESQIEDNPDEEISIKEEPLDISIPTVISNEFITKGSKRSISDPEKSSCKKIKLEEIVSENAEDLKVKFLLAEEKRKEHLYQMELKYKEDLFNMDKKYKEEIYKKELEVKEFELMLLRKKMQNNSNSSPDQKYISILKR